MSNVVNNFELAFEYVMKSEDSQKSGIVTQEPPVKSIDKNPLSSTFNREIVTETPKARFGINSHAHPEAVAAGFYEMDVDSAYGYAKNVYKKIYWDPLQLDSVPDWAVGAKVLDIAINAGVIEARILLSRAVIAAGSPIMDKNFYNIVMPKLILAEKEFYTKLRDRDPNRNAKYYKNWMERAERLPRPLGQ